MRQHAADMPVEELLALTAHMVGQILAMQDQRKMTPAMGMKLIADNIEQGNREAIDGLSKSEGTATCRKSCRRRPRSSSRKRRRRSCRRR
jgi:hypothetical protein